MSRLNKIVSNIERMIEDKKEIMPDDLEESVKIDDRVIEMCRKWQDKNEYSKVLVAMAGMLGFKKYSRILSLLGQIQDIEGHMPSELERYRFEITKSIRGYMKNHLSPSDQERVRNFI